MVLLVYDRGALSIRSSLEVATLLQTLGLTPPSLKPNSAHVENFA